MTIQVAEFLAVEDLLDDTIAEAGNLSASDAIDVRLAIEKMMAKARMAIDALNIGLLDTLEDSIIRDGREFARVPAGKQVYDHDEIAKRVALLASQPDEDGVVPTAHRAAAEAARMLRQVYASDSTPAKTGKLKAFGIDPNEVRDFVGEGTFKITMRPATTPSTDRGGDE